MQKRLPLVLWRSTEASGRVIRGLRRSVSDNKLLMPSVVILFTLISSNDKSDTELRQCCDGILPSTSSSLKLMMKNTRPL